MFLCLSYFITTVAVKVLKEVRIQNLKLCKNQNENHLSFQLKQVVKKGKIKNRMGLLFLSNLQDYECMVPKLS